MKPFPISVVGAGSHMEDEALSYIEMPHDMHTYRAPSLPEPELLSNDKTVRELLSGLVAAMAKRKADERVVVALHGMTPEALTLLGQILGEGEVSARVEHGDTLIQIQESVFAGVWRVRAESAGEMISDTLEVAAIPAALVTTESTTTNIVRPQAGPEVANGPALLTEIEEHLRLGTSHHVLNLTLLPFTPGDGEYLDAALGRGAATILSRGYGNCRITATAQPRVWWVQYFNAQDALILNTLEVVDIPEVACAAEEDLADSRERLVELLEWIA